MARKSIKIETLKALLARSGNQCAFPGCVHPIINENNTLIAQLCHIYAANEGGERFKASQTDEERRAYENLLFLCYRHHVETNDVEAFPASALREMKARHERNFHEPFEVENNEDIVEIQRQIEQFWNRLTIIHQVENEYPDDIKMEVDFDAQLIDLIRLLRIQFDLLYQFALKMKESDERLEMDLDRLVKSIDFFGIVSRRLKKIPYYRNQVSNRNWEYHNLGVPNFKSKISLLLSQIEIKVLEGLLIEEPGNHKLIERMGQVRAEFQEQVKNAAYVD